MKIHRGMLDKLVVIQKRSTAKNPSGQRADTWINFVVTYAHIKPLIGKEYIAAKELNNDITHDITIGYKRNISVGMRIKYGGRYFEITSALDPEERRVWLFLKCKEAVY